MVNARLCETARQAFFSANMRHFNFLDCETVTLNMRSFQKTSNSCIDSIHRVEYANVFLVFGRFEKRCRTRG